MCPGQIGVGGNSTTVKSRKQFQTSKILTFSRRRPHAMSWLPDTAQVMDFVPRTSFTRIVNHYSGNAGVRRMNCAEQFCMMAFAQLTWRESLRDIVCTLASQFTTGEEPDYRVNRNRWSLSTAIPSLATSLKTRQGVIASRCGAWREQGGAPQA